MKRYKLMIPGPVSVDSDVLAEMGAPVVAHYGKEWAEIHKETISLAQKVFQTKNDLFIIVGSGTASLEAALGSLASDRYKIFVPINGAFSRRLFELASSHTDRVKAEEFDISKPIPSTELDRILSQDKGIRVVATVHCETHTGVVNPIQEYGEICKEHDCLLMVDAVSSLGGIELKTDEWNIDLCVTASQKALEAPPGLSLISVSPRAWELIETNDSIHGWYLNLNIWRKYAKEWRDFHPSHVTMAVNNFLALRKSFKRILEEGLERRFERHKKVTLVLRQGLRNLSFELFAADEWASSTVTSVKVDSRISAERLITFVRDKHGIQIAGCLGELEGKIFRVGHMGSGATLESIIPLLFAIEEALRDAGADVKVGQSLYGINL